MHNYLAMLAYPHAHTVYQGFAQSLAYEFAANDGIQVIHAERCYPGDDLALGRNRIVSEFLDTGFDWLLMVDTDMVFPTGTLDALVTTATEWRGANGPWPVVSGHYKIQLEKQSTWRGVPKSTPVIDAAWLWQMGGGFTPFTVSSLPLTAARGIPVDAVGAGCLLMHRETLEVFTEQNWFSIIRDSEHHSFGEDMSFCLRLRKYQIPLLLAHGVKLTHFKERWI